MNLEDRLRSHLHSGPELLTDSSTTAADLTAAGHRRTRRNRAVAGGAAVVAAFVLVGGAFTLSGAGDDLVDDSATVDGADATSMIESADGEAGVAEDFDVEAAEGGSDGALDDIEFFDGPIPAFDSVVGVDGGFAGLRNRDGDTFAIRSDGGPVFRESPTNGIPNGATFVELVTDDGVFASIFTSFDGDQLQQWIGTSDNLTDWTLVEASGLDGGQTEFIDIDLEDGRVLILSVSVDVSRQEAEDAIDTGEFDRDFGVEYELLSGPLGGPYGATSLPDGSVNQVSASGDVDVVLLDSATGRDILRSNDGGTWEPVSGVGQDIPIIALNEVGDVLFATSFDGSTVESIDQGATWTNVNEIPQASSADPVSGSVRSGDSTLAVFVETFDENGPGTQVLYLRSEDGWSEFDVDAEYDRRGVGEDDFTMVAAVNDEELLIQVFRAEGGLPGADPTYLSIPIG